MRAAAGELRRAKEESAQRLPASAYGPCLHKVLYLMQNGDVNRAGALAGKWGDKMKGIGDKLDRHDLRGAVQQCLDDIRRVAEEEALAEASAIQQSALSEGEAKERKNVAGQGIHTLTVDGVNFLTEEAEIDRALAEYWEKVFGPPTLGQGAAETTQAWLRALGGSAFLPQPSPGWDDRWVEVACRRASTSSPGLDGIPYEAYKRAPEYWRVLQRAGRELYNQGAEAHIPQDFNWS
eukprot:4107912-Lingulodinium_polyedra.AAC.1